MTDQVSPTQVLEAVEIGKQFNIEPRYVIFAKKSSWKEVLGNDDVSKNRYVKWNEKNNEFEIGLLPDITYKQFIGLWKIISDLKNALGLNEKTTRHRAPERPELLYRIDRCRSQGMKYSEIFDLYKEGELPGYTSAEKTYLSNVSEMTKYYTMYYPDS